MPTAAALIIGNEILSGKVRDANTVVLSSELRTQGVDLRRVLVVPDELPDIVEGVQMLSPRHDYLFTSGGVGPTHDDVTMAGIALGLGRKLVRHAEMAALLTRWYDEGTSPLAFRMADLPEGAELLWGEDLKLPVVVVENVYVLPGVPSHFERKMRALRGRFGGVPWRLVEVLVDADEVDIAALLFDLVDRHPGLALGSYPEFGNPRYKVKLTLESRDAALVERALAELVAGLPAGSLRS